jgi:hypothetical protein
MYSRTLAVVYCRPLSDELYKYRINTLVVANTVKIKYIYFINTHTFYYYVLFFCTSAMKAYTLATTSKIMTQYRNILFRIARHPLLFHRNERMVDKAARQMYFVSKYKSLKYLITNIQCAMMMMIIMIIDLQLFQEYSSLH